MGDVDRVDAAVRRARVLRERAIALERRTYELVEDADHLLQKIDEHTGSNRGRLGQPQPRSTGLPSSRGR